MDRATDLRRLADLCKRMAEVPTSGGHRADRRLLTLAERLDREVAELGKDGTPSRDNSAQRAHSGPRY